MRMQPSLGSKDHRWSSGCGGTAAALGHALVALSGVTLPVMFSKHHPDTLDRTNGMSFLAVGEKAVNKSVRHFLSLLQTLDCKGVGFPQRTPNESTVLLFAGYHSTCWKVMRKSCHSVIMSACCWKNKWIASWSWIYYKICKSATVSASIVIVDTIT